jgi:hypothetical protein
LKQTVQTYHICCLICTGNCNNEDVKETTTGESKNMVERSTEGRHTKESKERDEEDLQKNRE